MKRLLVAALLLSSTAYAKTMVVTGVVLDQSSSSTGPTVQKLAMAAGETGEIDITVTHVDGTAYNLTGAQVLFAVNSKISRQATITNASAGQAKFPLVIADTLSMLGTYSYDITVTATDGSFYRVVPASAFVVTAGIGQPGQAVTVPASQTPLAQGPAGATGATGAAGTNGLPNVVQDEGTPLPTRTALNFTGAGVSCVDNSGAGRTDCTIPSSGLPAGLPVLYFNGAGQHVDHGQFWKAAQHLGNAMRWEAWAQGDPWNPSEYIIADGYGGSHALLWSGTSGNMHFWTGSAETDMSFGGDDTPPPGVFSHVLVAIGTDAYSNNWISTYINGISVGKALIPAGWERMVTSGAAGQGALDVGGSDHSNFKGWIAAIRGFDTATANDFGAANNWSTFVPNRNFSAFGPAYEPVDFLASYIGLYSNYYADLSSGYDSDGGYARRTVHPGHTLSSYNATDSFSAPITAYPVPTPTFVTNAPFDPNYAEAAPSRGLTPTTPPGGAKLYDSFHRPDQEYAHVRTPTLGSVEYSSIGSAPAWTCGSIDGSSPTLNSLAGIFNGSAVPLSNLGTICYVPDNSGNMTVSVDRRTTASGYASGETGLAFRVQDTRNGWVAWYQHVVGASGNLEFSSLVVLGKVVAGSLSIVDTYSVASTDPWVTLSVVASGSSITVKIDGTTAITATDATFASATGAGLFFDGAPGAGGAAPSTLSRFYNFTVK